MVALTLEPVPVACGIMVRAMARPDIRCCGRTVRMSAIGLNLGDHGNPCDQHLIDVSAHIIPIGADAHALAQSRKPMDMMVQGCATSLFQAAQQ